MKMACGYWFYWFTTLLVFNNRIVRAAVFERSHRVVIEEQWLNLYKNAKAENLLIVGSDHGPIMLMMDFWDRVSKNRPFRFKARWLFRKAL